MKMPFVVATPAPTPKYPSLLGFSYAYAAILTAVLLYVLFKFDMFVSGLETGLFESANDSWAKLLAGFTVLCLLFGLPFLLRLKLSPLARACSVALTVLGPLLFLLFAVNNSGFSFELAVPLAVTMTLAAIASVCILNGRSALARLTKL